MLTDYYQTFSVVYSYEETDKQTQCIYKMTGQRQK